MIVNLPKDMAPDTTRIWFLPEETPYFFWLIPHSQTSGALGLIGETEQDTLQSLESFLEKKDLEPLEFQWGRIPKYTRWIPNHRMIRENHVYLVGDAAGHVKVSTVGGIVTGFHGALGVVELILNGGSSRQLQTLCQELERHRLIRKVLHGFTQSDYARLLAMLNPTTKRLLSAFTRDDTGKLLWNVALRQPRLLLLGLRSLLSLR